MIYDIYKVFLVQPWCRLLANMAAKNSCQLASFTSTNEFLKYLRQYLYTPFDFPSRELLPS